MPQGWCVPIYNHWNNGMVEKWNIGNQKRMRVLFYILIRAIFIETGSIPLNAGLQYSNIPVFHHSMASVHGTTNFL
jgi:hypothetical protein